MSIDPKVLRDLAKNKPFGGPHDLARLHFEATIPPKERIELRAKRAERLRTRRLPNRQFHDYAPATGVPIQSIRPFTPKKFYFAKTAENVTDLLEMSVAWEKILLISVKVGDVEQLVPFAAKSGIPLAFLLRAPSLSNCAVASDLSIGLWNTGDDPVPFRVTCEGLTMPEGT